ncbi:MAG: SurA N-terminal domain-containing protein [Polycyclovorans sp.]|jgi:peptidyl-prolyl cis-trans isomerase D|nr:SurA N-terminal domain-containing protein [Polycyclovorans sp.]
MLQSIRDSLSGWVLWFVVGLIAVPFAFVGIESFRMGNSDPVLVEVGDTEITESQFRAAFDQRFRQLQQMMGDSFRPDMINTAEFRAAVLQDMSNEALLLQYAREQGYRGSDAEVMEYLRGLPAFQRDGRFSAEAYRDVLAGQGIDPEYFESQLRNALAIDQMRSGVLESAVVPDALLDNRIRLQQQQRSLSTLVVPSAPFVASIEPTEAEINARYEQNQAQYQKPERVRLDYVMLDPAQLAEVPEPEPSVLEALYEAEKARFVTGEKRRARHILIPLDADKDAARDKAAELRARIADGADFAALAAEFSSDTGSKDQGGDLGWIEKGQMAADFEAALFALDEGEVSEPVVTEFGVHLIRADEVKPEQVLTLEDDGVREQLLTRYRERERALRMQDRQEQLDQLTFENANSLQPVAEALDLEVQQTDWFTRDGGAGLLAERGILNVAFTPELIDANENSRPIALSDGRVVVVRKADYEAPSLMALDTVVDDIRQALKQEGARVQALALAEQIKEEAAAAPSSEGLATLAEKHGLTYRVIGPVGRDSANVDPAVLARLFALPKPADDAAAPTLSVVMRDDGDAAVIAFSGVQQAAVSEVDRVAARDRITQMLAGREFEAYQAIMRDAVPVKQRRSLTGDESAP